MLLQMLVELPGHAQDVGSYIGGDLLIFPKVNDGFSACQAAQQGGPPGRHGLPQGPAALPQSLPHTASTEPQRHCKGAHLQR